MPDVSVTIEDSVDNGGLIWTTARGRGTATGPSSGAQRPSPTSPHRRLARVVDGRITSAGRADRFAILAQTGVLDRPGAVTATRTRRTAYAYACCSVCWPPISSSRSERDAVALSSRSTDSCRKMRLYALRICSICNCLLVVERVEQDHQVRRLLDRPGRAEPLPLTLDLGQTVGKAPA